jgi:hypothetical protein
MGCHLPSELVMRAGSFCPCSTISSTTSLPACCKLVAYPVGRPQKPLNIHKNPFWRPTSVSAGGRKESPRRGRFPLFPIATRMDTSYQPTNEGTRPLSGRNCFVCRRTSQRLDWSLAQIGKELTLYVLAQPVRILSVRGALDTSRGSTVVALVTRPIASST